MNFNKAGMELLKSFESCKLKAYKCPAGIWTIGWGHTGKDVREGLEISQIQADALLQKDLNHFIGAVSALLKHNINDNRFSALVCFAYNVGVAALAKSLLLVAINKNEYESAAKQFMRWNHADGKIVDGLTRRRQAERELFEA